MRRSRPGALRDVSQKLKLARFSTHRGNTDVRLFALSRTHCKQQCWPASRCSRRLTSCSASPSLPSSLMFCDRCLEFLILKEQSIPLSILERSTVKEKRKARAADGGARMRTQRTWNTGTPQGCVGNCKQKTSCQRNNSVKRNVRMDVRQTSLT